MPRNTLSAQDPYASERGGLSNLLKKYPELHGFLGGVMGTAPDEFDSGSVLDDEATERSKAVKLGAKYGFPIGTALGMLPFGGSVAAAKAPVAGGRAAQRGVIKAPGGNWLSGSVEDSLRGLKHHNGVDQGPESFEGLDPRMVETIKRGMGVDNWIDKQLTRYVKNDMATERDPIRALAERGTLHYDADPFGPLAGTNVSKLRNDGGFPVGGLGKSDLAKTWENVSDAMLRQKKAGELLTPSNKAPDWRSEKQVDILQGANPWLAKVPPETSVYSAKDNALSNNLGFNHLIDELRNATNPASGLPAELLLKYDALDKVSVPQAVERVAKINAWREAQKVEANQALANNAATVLHKEYPEGMRWVELRKSKDLPEGWADMTENGSRFRGPKGEISGNDPRTESLRDALKYEGDTMGHCVGGYCDDVASGKTKIYSLRDKKGQPHVTIESRPGKEAPEGFGSWENVPEDVRISMESRGLAPTPKMIKDGMVYGPDGKAAFVHDPSIIQIKGKGNKKPNDEYLPFVQDFVRSGKWSDVGDLQNTGLERARERFNANALKTLEEQGKAVPPYATRAELEELRNFYGTLPPEVRLGTPQRLGSDLDRGLGDWEPEFAAGGLVHNDYDQSRVDSLVAQLQSEFT